MARVVLPGGVTCVEELRGEHELIRGVLDGLEAVSARLRRDLPVSPGFMAAAAAFVGDFVVACHERKEEDGLFAALRAHAASTEPTPTIGVSEPEHRRIRHALDASSAALARSDPEARSHLESCIAMLRRHLAREERRLFPVVSSTLTADEDAGVLARFRHVEREWLANGRLGAMQAVSLALAEGDGEGTGGPSAPPLCVRDVMRTEVARVGSGESLAHAAAAMNGQGVREVAVVDDVRLVGLLTQSDLLPHHGHLEWTLVRTAMTRDVLTVTPDTRVDAAARMLLEHSVNALPVVDGDRLAGMLGRADLLRVVTRTGARARRPSS